MNRLLESIKPVVVNSDVLQLGQPDSEMDGGSRMYSKERLGSVKNFDNLWLSFQSLF